MTYKSNPSVDNLKNCHTLVIGRVARPEYVRFEV